MATAADTLSAPVEAQLSRFSVRLIEEAISDALPFVWERRAEQLEQARPRPGDFNGLATAEDLATRDQRLAEQAAAVREHAELLRRYPVPIGQDLAAVVESIIRGGARGDRSVAA